MAGITFPGIGSGIDGGSVAKSLYDQLTQTNQLRRFTIDSRVKENSSLEKLRSLLLDLQESLDSARSANGGAGGKNASSSNTEVVAATATAQAGLGSYAVSVSQLARSANGSFSRGYSSSTEFVVSNSADSGEINVTVGEGAAASSFSMVVTETTTAADLVEQFNSRAAGKATASLINTGTTAAPSYRITFGSTATGVEQGSVSVSGSAQTLAALGGVTVEQARNAQLSVTGVSGTIERASNTVSDAIAGVTIELKAVGASTVQVGSDLTKTKGQLQGFISAYNKIVQFGNKEDTIVSSVRDGQLVNTYGSLVDSNVDDNARAALRGAISGAVSADGSLSLAALGVSTNRDGTLALDQNKFDQAFNSNPAATNQVVTGLADRTAGVQGVVHQYTGYNLTIDQAINSNSAEIKSLETTISAVERSAAKQQEAVLRQFTHLETLIAKLNADSSFLSGAFKF